MNPKTIPPQRDEREQAAPKSRPTFQRPTLRKLGQLPRVTTAFGGSFSP
ncbi:MAG: hypothetical protein H6737_29565 [Alphaproteobacteria bacterium]|nr:hypothetical protein [Alphaproteobacteria bacterium]